MEKQEKASFDNPKISNFLVMNEKNPEMVNLKINKAFKKFRALLRHT